jgi:hypothetical protein
MRNTSTVPRLIPLTILLGLLISGCGKEIGDECLTNIDCNQDGTWDCDLSQPGGYCTVAGCDEASCPEKSVCIRFFSYQFSSDACQTDFDCGAEFLCLSDGICSPRASERRFCERTCGNDGDCRGGYVCRTAGIPGTITSTNTYGSLALIKEPNQSKVVRFCVARP